MTSSKVNRSNFSVTTVLSWVSDDCLGEDELRRLLVEACHALEAERQKLDAARDGVAALAAGLGVGRGRLDMEPDDARVGYQKRITPDCAP